MPKRRKDVILFDAPPAAFLLYTFGPKGNGQPQYSWFIWAIGGILYAALVLVVKMALRKQNNK